MSKVIEYNNFLKNYMKDFDEKNIIIYGNNNCGKTYLLKEIFKVISTNNKNLILQNSINKIKSYDLAFAHLFDVNRIGKEEADYVKKDLDINCSSEYFDNLLNKIDHNISINNYRGCREWICTNGKAPYVENVLKKIFISSQNFEFSKYDNYSDGVKNAINILSTLLLLRNENNNKFSSFNLKPVILIDEIELYLHISAQVKFVDYLINEFNEFRFVFTSHSPVLMQRINNCSIYILNENHTKLTEEESQYFFSCDDIMEKSFGLNKYPDQLIDFLQYLNECKTNPNKFSLDKYRAYLNVLRLINYNYNLLINNVILEFIAYQKKNPKVKKGSEMYNAIHS